MTTNYVQFARPMIVTNADCCSDSKVMCPKCAAAALAAAGTRSVTVNVPEGGRPQFTVNTPDDGLETIPQPTCNWHLGTGAKQKQAPAVASPALTTNEGRRSMRDRVDDNGNEIF